MKQDRARRTYDQLLDSAATEFLRHGFTGTNLAAVAARSQVTKGALYGHFASKAELADELTRRFEDTWAQLLSSSGRSDRSLVCTLRELTTELARRLDDDPRFAAGLRLATDAARVDRREPAPIGELRDVLESLVREAQRDGRTHTEQRPEVLARLVLVLLLGTHSTRWGAEGGGLAEQVREIWDVVQPVMAERPAGGPPRVPY
ncbi:TetR family transcriptional regulator [Streptomyces sp. NBC_00576]|uniref:TetR family transcriptional regulator n=1 Tax=Streptomyces sp. NBC_00576 TaxID=2903665 RepID=UPI002E81EA81|nr:TetR family transcriptional regulator [Streptomyces sp. NBC_00576]WUB72209.1 TetR family transcriptional regulator [Streptomyces sp. NBC_00576]